VRRDDLEKKILDFKDDFEIYCGKECNFSTNPLSRRIHMQASVDSDILI